MRPRRINDVTAGEPAALEAWHGHGAAPLPEYDPTTGSMLLVRLDAERDLSALPDDLDTLRILSELMADLHSVRDIRPAIDTSGLPR